MHPRLAAVESFHSLQTGKRISRLIEDLPYIDQNDVSIPFKRESVSQATGLTTDASNQISFHSLQTGKRISREGFDAPNADCIVFQFPSNGKAYLKLWSVWANLQRYRVSIPFKRESVSQAKKGEIDESTKCKVSIPFKRESVSQDRKSTISYLNANGFNSLQTGKRISRIRKHGRKWGLFRITFQFPSNGKAYLKHDSSNRWCR